MLCIFLLMLLTTGYVQAQEAPERIAGAMTVNVGQAKRLFDLGAVFIDVRPVSEWSWGHVHGAVHLDLSERFAGLARPEWPREVPLVIYCDSDVCPRGAVASALAVKWGYKQVFYFREGYFAWMLQDYPQGKGLAGEVVAFSP
ncbi:rhodanese-like domain-containing protein [Pseudomonas sp. PS02288]|uniref:rhodanese-like domain-containing protein n=1 Tax=Pseudomonas sp. PS02288 TaxID=2991443 RepID=UPI00249A5EB0|nr:rhodanese-like domain-containing protein [Pseudomonas sp. PS02288]